MLGNLRRGRNEKHTTKTHTRTGIAPHSPPYPSFNLNRHTLYSMTAHNAFRIWFNDFLSVDCFARHHGLTREKARELIREGREIEAQIEKLKQEHAKKQKENL